VRETAPTDDRGACVVPARKRTRGLLDSDDQISAPAKAGRLTMTDAHIVLNAPILTVGNEK